MNGLTQKNAGFTLVEVMMTALLFGTVIVGLIWTFITCSLLTEMTGNISKLYIEAQAKIEEMRNHTFSTLVTDYSLSGTPGNKFSISDPQAMGVIYLDATNPNLILVNIKISFSGRNGRIVGEDLDLDGTIDAGEDVVNIGVLDSPISLSTIIGNKS